MFIRKDIRPKTIADTLCCGLIIFLIIPAVYWFEIFVVIPYFYEIWSFWYILHWTCGTFVGFNVITNLLAIILFDTSIKGRVLPVSPQPGWRFCTSCECFVPPRSWHCNICKTCILKRDHHCLFSGCCVGHENYRYFFMFVLYLFIALIYSACFNTQYVRTAIDLKNVSWISVIFPLAMIFFNHTYEQFVLLMYLLLLFSMFFVGTLLYFHLCVVMNGQNMFERGHNIHIYDLGTRGNIESVFGKNWHVCWILPFIDSPLTQDGVNWETVEREKTK